MEEKVSSNYRNAQDTCGHGNNITNVAVGQCENIGTC